MMFNDFADAARHDRNANCLESMEWREERRAERDLMCGNYAGYMAHERNAERLDWEAEKEREWAMDDRMMEMGMARPYGQPVYGQPGYRQQPARYGGAAVVPQNAYARPAAQSMNAFANAVVPSAQPMGLAAAANAMESSASHVGVGYRYSFKMS